MEKNYNKIDDFFKKAFEQKLGCEIFAPSNFVAKCGNKAAGSKKFATQLLLKSFVFQTTPFQLPLFASPIVVSA